MSIELVIPFNRLIFCHPLLLLPSIFPSIRVFSSESAVHIRWPKYWSFSFSISLSNDYSWLISFRIDWSDLLAVWPSVNQRVRPGSHPSLIAIRRNQPCWHLDFRLLASRAVREWISVVSATPLGVPCYSSPSRLTQVKDKWQHSWVQWEKVRRTFTFYPTHLYSNSYFSKNVYWWAASDLSFSILDLLWHTGSFLPCTGFL